VDRLLSRLSVRRPSRDDGGFSLVEVTVSLVVLTVTMTSALTLFVRAIGNADVQAQRQQAITIANDQLEQVRTVDVTRPARRPRPHGRPGPLGLGLDSSRSSASSSPTRRRAHQHRIIPTIKTSPSTTSSTRLRTYIDLCYLPTTRRLRC
jgi:prepilin-type N-terminal cleavage/methylation domain-containing protein